MIKAPFSCFGQAGKLIAYCDLGAIVCVGNYDEGVILIDVQNESSQNNLIKSLRIQPLIVVVRLDYQFFNNYKKRENLQSKDVAYSLYSLYKDLCYEMGIGEPKKDKKPINI